MNDDLERKINEQKSFVTEVIEERGVSNGLLRWDGLKETTLLVHLLGSETDNIDTIEMGAFYQPSYQPGVDTDGFVDEWADVLVPDSYPFHKIKSTPIERLGYDIGEKIHLEALPVEYQEYVKEKLSFTGKSFKLSGEDYIGQHVLQQIPRENHIGEVGADVVFTAPPITNTKSGDGPYINKTSGDSTIEYDTVCLFSNFTTEEIWRATWDWFFPSMVDWEFEKTPSEMISSTGLPNTFSKADVPIYSGYFDGVPGTDQSKYQQGAAWDVYFDGEPNRGGQNQTSLQTAINNTESILRRAQRHDRYGLLFTGGKDSMIILHLWRELVGEDLPLLVVDTHNHFDSIYEFRDELASKWGLDYNVKSNENFLQNVIYNDDDPRDFAWDGFKTRGCCQALKVDMIEDFVEDGFDVLISGRREEDIEGKLPPSTDRAQPAPHRRYHPLANWTQQHIELYLKQYDIPLPDLYERGYVHTDCIDCTIVGEEGDDWSDAPASKKESLDQLRSLGYF